MNLSEAFYNFWRGYIDFKGQSSRSEFWWDILIFIAILPMAITQINTGLNFVTNDLIGTELVKIFGTLYLILMIIPMISLLSRRYHDVGFYGSWVMCASIVSIILIASAFLMEMTTIISFGILCIIIINLIIGLLPTGCYRSPK